MNDRLDYSIDGVQKTIEKLRETNDTNVKMQEKILDYINLTLAAQWNTQSGREAIKELVAFIKDGEVKGYIDSINELIARLEDIVPNLNNIEN